MRQRRGVGGAGPFPWHHGYNLSSLRVLWMLLERMRHCVGVLQAVTGMGALFQPGEPSPACLLLSQKNCAFLWPWLLSHEVGTAIGTRDLETMTSLHQNGLSNRVNNCRTKESISILLFPWQE